MKVAVAVFVKTPGKSPIKTRLAAGTSRKVADEFYDLSLGAVRSVLQAVQNKFPEVIPYWAIAEEEGLTHKVWSDFSQISQEGEGLGERLDAVYAKLRKEFPAVILLGADCPLMGIGHLEEAVSLLENSPAVIGSTSDGGFYLFGASLQIPRQFWLDIPYSVKETTAVLREKISSFATLQTLPELFDVDTVEDLQRLASEEVSAKQLTPEQLRLLNWARSRPWEN